MYVTMHDQTILGRSYAAGEPVEDSVIQQIPNFASVLGRKLVLATDPRAPKLAGLPWVDQADDPPAEISTGSRRGKRGA